MRSEPPLAASTFFELPPDRITRGQETAFFSSLKVHNRTSKQTDDGRLAAIDAELSEFIRLSGASVSNVLDIGVSSGITTVELLDTLRKAGFSPQVTGTDLTLDAAIRSPHSWGRVLVDEGGRPLQFEVLGRPIRAWTRRRDYVTGAILLRWALSLVLARAGDGGAASNSSRPVRLVSPRLRSFPEITLQRDDILNANPGFVGRFDLIRAANVLNRRYFDEAKLRRIVRNLTNYLAGEGALLLVVRTYRGAGNRGSLFRLDAAGRLTVVKRFGEGSEFEPLLLGGG